MSIKDLKRKRYLVESDGVRCDLNFIGEGYGGEYDEDDSSDMPLMRLCVTKRSDGAWRDVDEGSFCTNIGATEEPHRIMTALGIIWGRYHDLLKQDKSVKSLSAGVSFLSTDEIIASAGKL